MESIDKSMVDFIKKVSEDQALAEKMSKSANPEEAYGIAKENGVTVSFDEFRETMKVLAALAKGELSEEEMQAVAGGMPTWEGLGIIAGSTAAGVVGGALIGVGAGVVAFAIAAA